MADQENKDLVRRYFDERWNKKNYAVVDELLPAADAEEAKAFLRQSHDTISEIQLSIGDMVAEGELVAIHCSISAVLRKPVAGVGATGDQVSSSGIAMLRVRNGQIVEDRAYMDEVGAALFSGSS
jgi:predicted ester cyclase